MNEKLEPLEKADGGFFQTYKLVCCMFFLFIHHVSCSWQLNLSMPPIGFYLDHARNGCLGVSEDFDLPVCVSFGSSH